MSDRMAARAPSIPLRVLRFVVRNPFAFAVGLVLAVAVAAGLHFLERREEIAGERRFAVRAGMASAFVSAYLADLRVEQRAAAGAYLESGRKPGADLARFVEANRFSGALLLDSAGRVTHAHPLKPGLIGTRLAPRYEHLRRALGGRNAVSDVVPSAVERIPVVAIATPVRTPAGRGVLSTAYKLSASPLTAYLASAMPMREDEAYLVDTNGNILASKRRETDVTRLSVRDASLARAVSQRSSGVFTDDGVERFFVVRRVGGTPWRFVATRPLATVHPTWHGEHRWVSGVLASLVGAAVLAICALLTGLLETRTRLLRDVARREQVEAELTRERALFAHRATHDPLTGLPNRALLWDRIEQAYAQRTRDAHRRAAMLFIDLDGFKPINDVHGHHVGDHVLTVVAGRLRQAVRPGDTVSRLGGDEFAILCDPLPISEDARAIAERIRIAVEQPIPIQDGGTVRVGASVGIAEDAMSASDPHRLLADADAAMYAAKLQRRGRRPHGHAGARA